MTTLASPDVLTQLRLRQLDDDGYFTTPVIFDEASVNGVRGEFLRMWQEQIARADASGNKDEARYARQRLFLSQLDHASPICDAFCRHPAILEVLGQILGPDVDITWNQAIMKAPQAKETTQPGTALDNTFAWHQDMQYAVAGDYAKDTNPEIFLAPNTGLTLWIAISRTTVDNGTLWVLPGRHKEGLLKHTRQGDPVKGEWAGEYDTSYRVPAVLRPGQMIAFRKYLPHGSGQNVSNENRLAYQIGYSVPGLKTAPSRDVSPVLRGGKPVR
ncbi:MAG: phytanoyl-CoA dioxygenase family protein [Planctomycetota bacterium]|nr:phytanoyl-CoA dioxygenase family protein [Planctomycetota bacterium]